MPSGKSPERIFTDQMGRDVHLPGPPQRIISLVPSQTELLVDLGLEEQLVGITKYCVHPEHLLQTKTKVGGTKKFHHKRIASLAPDLIIGNKEENEEQQINTLTEQYPVWMSDIHNLEEALQMIRAMGAITATSDLANSMADRIQQQFAALRASGPALKVAYFIWREPWMVAGENTFIHDMLLQCGWTNAFAGKGRYPEVTAADLQEAQPDLVLLSSEPFPFQQDHTAEMQSILPDARVRLADGEFFSWYGSRLLQAPTYFSSLISD